LFRTFKANWEVLLDAKVPIGDCFPFWLYDIVAGAELELW